MLAVKKRVTAEVIDGTMLRRGHQPGAGIFGNTRFRPLLESGDEGILGQVLG